MPILDNLSVDVCWGVIYTNGLKFDYSLCWYLTACAMSLASCCSSISSFASFEELESSRGSAIDCSCSSKFESTDESSDESSDESLDESSDDESPVSGLLSIVSSFSGLNRIELSKKINQNNPLAFPFQTFFIHFSQLQSWTQRTEWPQWSNVTNQTPIVIACDCSAVFFKF